MNATTATNATTALTTLTADWLQQHLQPRAANTHKGSYGHALLIAGARGTVGASIIAARACLRSGVGLLTAHVPECAYIPLQTALPEAMVSTDSYADMWSDAFDLKRYDAIGVGCGIGQSTPTRSALHTLLLQNQHRPKPMVLDADALNILALEPELLGSLPAHCVLTPHPKEFERLMQHLPSEFKCDGFEGEALLAARLAAAQLFAQRYNVVLMLKGALSDGKSAVCCPDGTTYANTTGNAGMAKGGSGDALTGVVLGLLAQGYAPDIAACLSVYWHGAAGDVAAEQFGARSMLASDLIQCLGKIVCV